MAYELMGLGLVVIGHVATSCFWAGRVHSRLQQGEEDRRVLHERIDRKEDERDTAIKALSDEVKETNAKVGRIETCLAALNATLKERDRHGQD